MPTEKVGLIKKYKGWNSCAIPTCDVSYHNSITIPNNDNPK